MMDPSALSFVLYSLGISLLTVAAAGSFNIVWRTIMGRHRKLDDSNGTTPKWEPVTDPTIDDLEGRLHAFRNTRFGAPLAPRPSTFLRPSHPDVPVPRRPVHGASIKPKKNDPPKEGA